MKINNFTSSPSDLWVGKSLEEDLRDWEKREAEEKKKYGYKLEAVYLHDGEEEIVEMTFLGVSNNGSIAKVALILINKLERDLNVKTIRHKVMPYCNGGGGEKGE